MSDANGSVDSSAYAENARKLNAVMNRLRAIGTDTHVPIPVIAIIGSQSAGKSSIVNAISGVQFPRAAGTCTRCPMECRILADEAALEWSCQIRLRFEYKRSNTSEVSTREFDFGKRITDKFDVESALRRAQLAVLNPDRHYSEFVHLDLDVDFDNQLSFTTNVVCLEIRSANSLNLTFIDLPGMIQTAREGEDPESPEIIKNLVLKYIQQPSTIILVAVSMETEYENQIAPKLAREHDPAGLRTIGVLTKPDIARESTSKAYIPIIRNEKEKLHHSWYVVKSPELEDGDEPPSADIALAQEAAWFASISSYSAWRSLDPRLSSQFGIPKLTKKLSQILDHLNMKSFPSITAAVRGNLAKTKEALRQFPDKQAEDPCRLVAKLIASYSSAIASRFNGAAIDAPRFRPFPKSDIVSQLDEQSSDKSDGSEDEQKSPDETLCEGEEFSKPVRGGFRKGPNLLALSYKEPDFLLDRTDLDMADYVEHNASVDHLLLLDLDDIKAMEEEFRTTELPGNVPFDVQRELIKRSVAEFKTYAIDLFEASCRLVDDIVVAQAQKIFAAHTFGGLNESIKSLSLVALQEFKDNFNAYIDTRLDIELLVHSNNPIVLASYKAQFLDHYRKLGKPEEVQPKDPRQDDPLALLARQFGKNVDFLKELLCGRNKQDEAALAVMAEVRAYWQVAYTRFVDDMPMHLLIYIVRRFVESISDRMLDGIQTTGPDAQAECARLVREPEDVVFQRQSLLDRKKKLEEAANEVARF